MTKRDTGLDIQLSLDGETFFDESGYWYKIEAKRVPETPQIPHGINYNLPIHNRYNTRIYGFDNAHAVQPRKKSKGYLGRRVEYDHKHISNFDKGRPYTFVSAEQLLEDFFAEVNRIIQEGKL